MKFGKQENALTEDEINAIYDALNLDSPSNEWKWESSKGLNVLLAPAIFSSEEFNTCGWAFLFYWKQRLFKLALNKVIMSEYLVELDKNSKMDPLLRDALKYFFKMKFCNLRKTLPLYEFDYLEDNIELNYLDILKKIDCRVVAVVKSCDTSRTSKENHSVFLSELINKIASENPVAMEKISL